jgi:hypothetical protein
MALVLFSKLHSTGSNESHLLDHWQANATWPPSKARGKPALGFWVRTQGTKPGTKPHDVFRGRTNRIIAKLTKIFGFPFSSGDKTPGGNGTLVTIKVTSLKVDLLHKFLRQRQT